MLRGGGNSKITQDFEDSKKWFPKMYHNYSRSQRFQNRFPRCTEIPKNDLPKCINITKFSQTYKTTSNKSQRFFQTCLWLLEFIEMSRSPKMFQDLKAYWDSKMLGVRFLVTIVNANSLTPSTFSFKFPPPLFSLSQHAKVEVLLYPYSSFLLDSCSL